VAEAEVRVNWSDNVSFPARYKSLPKDYRIIQLDSGHFLWTYDGPTTRVEEGFVSWDRYWVRRCAFLHAKEKGRA
jgi:hypothetical protein